MSKNFRNVFVTGATGKIGKALVEQLLTSDYNVVALVRDKSKLPLNYNSLKIIEADILEVNKFKKEIRACDYVYHLAVYQNSTDPNEKEFIRVNVDGTKSILKALPGSKVKRFIYLSTIMVFESAGKKEIDESSPKISSESGNYYVDTKLLALKVIDKYRKKVPIIILYPTIVINSNEIIGKTNKSIDGWLNVLWKAIGDGVPGGLMCMIGNKNRIMNYILMNNLLVAMINAMDKGKEGNDYILGGENITVENYLREALRIKGKMFLPLRIPMSLLKIIALIKTEKFKMIDFVAKNPPKNICANSQKASHDLGLKISKLKNF